MKVSPTNKRNVMVLIQTRDLAKIRGRIELRLRKFDRTSFEVMPGVWHLVTGGDLARIQSKMIGAVTDFEDDRVLVIDNPDGFAAWDGHRGQHVRGDELSSRFVRAGKDAKGKPHRYLPTDMPAIAPPEWVNQSGSKKGSPKR